MLNDPGKDTNSVAVTVSYAGVSVLSERWHYIENRSKGPGQLLRREIYDGENDPYEETDLIDSSAPDAKAAIETLRKHAPQKFARSVETKHKSGPKKLDETIRKTRKHLR